MTETKKFLAVGHHGPVDPEEAKQVAAVALEWIPAQLQNGFLDCLYSMEGGGRLLIANSESKDALLTVLNNAPDARREWTITELFDGVDVIRNYLDQLARG
jgi:hypothetical protein